MSGASSEKTAYAIAATLLAAAPFLWAERSSGRSARSCEVVIDVHDSTSASVKNAQVLFKAEQGGTAIQGTTNDGGTFKTNLPGGIYRLEAASFGFRRYKKPNFRVTCPESKPVMLDVHLELPSYGR